MQSFTRTKKILCLTFAMLMVLFCLTGCGKENDNKIYTTLDDLNDAKLGIVTGTVFSVLADQLIPEAEKVEYNSIPDALMALDGGKVDAVPCDESIYYAMLWTQKPYVRIHEPLTSSDYGIIFGKNKNLELQNKFNTFLAEHKETLSELEEKWFAKKEPAEFISYDDLSGENGTLRVGTCSSNMPFVYLKNGKLSGFDVEVLTLFAREYGYRLAFEDTLFSSVLTGVSMGAYDIGAAGFVITEERAESVDFSNVYHAEELIVVTKDMEADVAMATMEKNGFENFFASLGESFEKTFVREARWKLILEGICTTLLISFFAVIGGTVLGFLLYLAARSKYQVLSSITRIFAKVYSKVIAGTPTLVVLMLLFYVVFGKSDISGIIVAIIGFILIFGSFVYGQLELTVDGVDKGQTEAAYALGYSRNQTFFRIILPQAMKMFVPVYSSEIIGLIKATSVVGYIAVNDLTKMGDIIRSNTYEAFFPLIAVAVIYFMITWGIAALLGILKRKTEPKRRKNKNILKGVVR